MTWLFAAFVVLVALLMGWWPLIVLPLAGAVILSAWAVVSAWLEGEP